MPDEFIDIHKCGKVTFHNVTGNGKCHDKFKKMMDCLRDKKNKNPCKDAMNDWDTCVAQKDSPKKVG